MITLTEAIEHNSRQIIDDLANALDSCMVFIDKQHKQGNLPMTALIYVKLAQDALKTAGAL